MENIIAKDLLLASLENELTSTIEVEADPLPVDRWLARSCLQKAIRRGDCVLATRSLATLYRHDAYGVWRHLLVIAFEDVGAANFETVAKLVAASTDYRWRRKVGGSWKVASFFASRLASGQHCQAACDLLLRARNEEGLRPKRLALAEGEPDFLMGVCAYGKCPADRAIAALALSGECGAKPQPDKALHALDNQPYSRALIELCSAAWRKTRDPMTLLFPIIWEHYLQCEAKPPIDDPFPEVIEVTSGVPGFALDQFTRAGNAAARLLLRSRSDLAAELSAAGIPVRSQPRAVGDLIFIREGGLLRKRQPWKFADQLRLPWRALPLAATVGDAMPQLLNLISDAEVDIAECRREAFDIQNGG